MSDRICRFTVGIRGPVAIGLVAVALTACRSEPERSAVGQVPGGGHGEATAVEDSTSVGSEATLRRVWSGRGLDVSAASPDGRWVTETDWSTGDLGVRDLMTGRGHRLTDKGSWGDSGDYALSSAFSPGGDAVAYSWWHGERGRHELRVLDFSVDQAGEPRGANPRVVYGAVDLGVYSVLQWSADDRVLVLLKRPDGSTALALISVDDGEATVLESFGWRTPNARRSPDGRFIAYDLPGEIDAVQRDIFLLTTDGGRKRLLVEGPENQRVLGWAPAGDRLLFLSEGSEGTKILEGAVSDGVPSGPPRILLHHIAGAFRPLGRAGAAFYLWIPIESNGFRVADVDVEGGRLLASPVPIGGPWGETRGWDWSPDGHHYALGAAEPRSSRFQVLISALDGTPVRRFDGDGRITGVERLRWSPDGGAIFLYARDETGHPGIQALDLSSGDLRTIRRFHREEGAMGGHFALSPDGGRVYFRLLDQGAPPSCPTDGSIMALELGTGEEHPLGRVRSRGSLAVSPDGEELAFVDCDPDSDEAPTLLVMPAAGGEPREVFRGGRDARIGGLNWTPDGRRIVFLGGDADRAGGHDLRVVSAAGGEVKTLEGVRHLSYEDPRLHPGGGRIAFRAGEDRGEIWALEEVTGRQPTHEGGDR